MYSHDLCSEMLPQLQLAKHHSQKWLFMKQIKFTFDGYEEINSSSKKSHTNCSPAAQCFREVVFTTQQAFHASGTHTYAHTHTHTHSDRFT